MAARRPAILCIRHPQIFQLTGWSARVGVKVGISKLYHWLQEHCRLKTQSILQIGDLVKERQNLANGINPGLNDQPYERCETVRQLSSKIFNSGTLPAQN